MYSIWSQILFLLQNFTPAPIQFTPAPIQFQEKHQTPVLGQKSFAISLYALEDLGLGP